MKKGIIAGIVSISEEEKILHRSMCVLNQLFVRNE